MTTKNYSFALRTCIALFIIFTETDCVTAGTFAVAPTYVLPSASISNFSAVGPSTGVLPSEAAINANLSGVTREATSTNFGAVTTPNSIASPAFVNPAIGFNSMAGQSYTGSFGTPQAPENPGVGGASNHEEVPSPPGMGAANSVSGTIANATGAPVISMDANAATPAVGENYAAGAINAVNSVGAERTMPYQSYGYAQTENAFGTPEPVGRQRVCLLPGNAQCPIGVGPEGKACFCLTPGGPVNGISR